MTKYLFIYHAPPMPADAPQPSAEEMQGVMAEWEAWGRKVGDRMVDFGAPVEGGKRVTPDGVSDSDRQVSGYTLLEAESFEEALDLARNHPHLAMPGGCEIEVHEAQPVPGM